MAALAEHVALHQLTLAGLSLPISLRPAEPLSDRDLIAFSRRISPHKLERNAQGELEIVSPVDSRGSLWEGFVFGELYSWVKTHGGVPFGSSAGFTLPDGSMRSPDAAWLQEDRWNALSDADQRRYAPVCPDFLVEVLSETDSRNKLLTKMDRWMENGARLAWMIDPVAAQVSIYRPGTATEVLERPHQVVADSVVVGFRLELSTLWE